MSEPLSSPVGNSEREYYADEMNKGWKARAEKAEAEAKELREALEQAYRDFDELSGAMEGDYDFVGIRNYAAICKCQARAALDAGKEK